MKNAQMPDHCNVDHNISTHAYPDSQDTDVSSSTSSTVHLPVASVGSSSSSSFTSIMSSPLAGRLSFQTFSNFIPIPWSYRSGISDAAAAPSPSIKSVPVVDDKDNNVTSKSSGGPPKRVFVSKERQLEKLRIRLEREGTVKMKTSVHVCCKKCDGRTVSL